METWKCPRCGGVNQKPEAIIRLEKVSQLRGEVMVGEDTIASPRCSHCNFEVDANAMLAGKYEPNGATPDPVMSSSKSQEIPKPFWSKFLNKPAVDGNRLPRQNDLQPFPPVVALLNLTGVGLGYLYLRCWLRWAIHLLLTIALFTIAYLNNAASSPWLWIVVWGIWFVWMAVDGWRLSVRLKQGTLKQPISQWGRHLAGALGLIVAMSGSMWAYYALGQREFDLGLADYRTGQFDAAIAHMQRVTNGFELTLNPNIRTADAVVGECNVLNGAAKVWQTGSYQEAVNIYETYLQEHPGGEMVPLVTEDVSQVYLDWAEALCEDTSYGVAVEQYTKVMQHYPSTSAGQEVPALMAETYWDWAALLQAENQYESALEKYQTLSSMEGRPFTDLQIHSAQAETYWAWAAFLRDGGKFEDALEIYQSLLKEEQPYTNLEIRSASSDAYSEWAIELAKQGYFDLAYEKCQILENEFSDTPAGQRIPALIGQVHYERGAVLSEEHKFTEALQEFELAKQATDDAKVNLAAEQGYEKTLMELAKDTSGEGQKLLEQVSEDACRGKGVDSPAFGLLNGNGKFLYGGELFTLPKDLVATMPGELKYVICAESSLKQLQRCKYVRTYSSARHLTMQQTWWRIWVNDPRTGETVINRTFAGVSPGSCPNSYQFSALEESIVGKPPASETIIEWLRGLID